jgi:hypothetical protein
MIPTKIEEALRQRFLAEIPDAAGKCSFENQPFDPKGVPVWFEFHFMPNRPDVASLGLDGLNEHTGILQIDIHVPKGSGRGVAAGHINTLCASFTPSLPIVYQGVVLTIPSCGQVPGGATENSYRFSVSIVWETRLPRGMSVELAQAIYQGDEDFMSWGP